MDLSLNAFISAYGSTPNVGVGLDPNDPDVAQLINDIKAFEDFLQELKNDPDFQKNEHDHLQKMYGLVWNITNDLSVLKAKHKISPSEYTQLNGEIGSIEDSVVYAFDQMDRGQFQSSIEHIKHDLAQFEADVIDA